MSSWWQHGVLYQVYPRSFQDSDGDGIGDLAGIERRLDYLVELGIDAIWISPFYPSPMIDFGYDITDYCDVDPRFGTLADFDRLLTAAHARDLKVILDFVPNHSSDRHPWFLESRSSRESARRDWYLWRVAADGGGPPNNWISDFGGPAWEWDGSTEQYYYHAFLKEQPDLNWRNPEVQQAMYAVLRFWLERGVDGFRIDVLWHMIKAADYPNNPPNPDYQSGMSEKLSVLQQYSTDQPEVHTIAAEMRRIADSFGERVLIGEIYLPLERLVHYYGRESPGVHLPFNFQLIEAPWRARELAKLIAEYEAALPPGGWPNWVLGNHDRPRIADRCGEAQARVAAMLLLTLRGTPTLYYGDELGLGHVAIAPQDVRDPLELRQPGLGLGRDPVRTPMPWDGSASAGFTSGSPWLPLNSDWRERNVENASTSPRSMLALYQRLLELRRAHPALHVGAFALIESEGDILAYERRCEDERFIVALNLGATAGELLLPSWALATRARLSTLDGDAQRGDRSLVLRPHEGLILGPRGGGGE
jgi:alpha-glucosidase